MNAPRETLHAHENHSQETPPPVFLATSDQGTLAAILLLFASFFLFWTFSQAEFGFRTPAEHGQESERVKILRLGRPSSERLTAPTRYLVDINQATVSDLILLPGIGEKTAQKIIDERNLHGEYVSVDDLTRVNGIGTKKVDTLRVYVQPIQQRMAGSPTVPPGT